MKLKCAIRNGIVTDVRRLSQLNRLDAFAKPTPPSRVRIRVGTASPHMQLVIVESPAKARTIEKYLGKDFKVLA